MFVDEEEEINHLTTQFSLLVKKRAKLHENTLTKEL